MSALPFVVQLLTKILFAGIADYLKLKHIISHCAVVKLFNLIGMFSKLLFIVLIFILKIKDL